ncbi:hypothetical protein ACFFIO_07130 [Citricoccus parietis]|uniref:Uncharacterized protein n=1 Tax=Citricoccus parietis TaxID=592307 RepID=A0ABV6F4D0_9MICC
MNSAVTINQAIDTVLNNQAVGVYAQTPDGKKAMQETIRDLNRAVTAHADRQAADAVAFHADLNGKLGELQAKTARIAELNAEFDGSAVMDEAKLDEFFGLEASVEYLAKQVFQMEGRIANILTDLEDPVGSLSRLEGKYSRIKRQYLVRFPVL